MRDSRTNSRVAVQLRSGIQKCQSVGETFEQNTSPTPIWNCHQEFVLKETTRRTLMPSDDIQLEVPEVGPVNEELDGA